MLQATNHRRATAVLPFSTRNDLPARVREKAVSLLNQQLADTMDLYAQIKQAHWNVKGPSFISLHKLFDELGEEVLEAIDEIAERATALGGMAMGTVRMSAKASRLPEFPAATDQREVIDALAERFAVVAKSTREGIDTADDLGDTGTADLLTQTSRELDKSLWFLEAHLQGRE
jgi:starvation-inducible DNA-binding protein